jgi:hypothetical protein
LDKVLNQEEKRDTLVTEAAAEVMAQEPTLEQQEPEIVQRELTSEEADVLLSGGTLPQ